MRIGDLRGIPTIVLLGFLVTACVSPEAPQAQIPQQEAPGELAPPAPSAMSMPTPPMVEPVDGAPRQQPPESASGVGELFPRVKDLGKCVIRGKTRRLTARVDPSSGPPFLLSLSKTPLAITLGKGDGAAAQVDFAGAFRFEASTVDVVATLMRAQVQHEGMLHAPRGARLVIGGETAEGLAHALTSIGVPIDAPCDTLELGGVEAPPSPPTQRSPIVMSVGDRSLLLAASPRAAPTLTLPSGLVFRRIAGGVDFVKITHRGWDGVTVSGYVPTSRVEEVGVMGTPGSGVGCGCGGVAMFRQHRGPDDPYEGPAKLREGVPVHASRDGGVWGRGVSGGAVTVKWAGRGDRWVQIVSVASVQDLQKGSCHCGGLTHAFVGREGVEF